MNAYSVNVQLINNDCLIALKDMEENSVDSIVTDPPYGLNFMGKEWDRLGDTSGKAQRDWHLIWAKECLRVLKPGGFLLAFGGSRTYHRMACAIEDAGFEIRDQIMWVYGSGFPKSLNIGKAIDKLQGNKREIVGVGKSGKPKTHTSSLNMSQVKNNTFGGEFNISKGNSDWEGYGTSLKPAHEPIVVARKPLSEKTVVANILKWGVGGINIDDCRIPYSKNNPPIPQLAQGKTEIKTDKKMYGRNSFNESKTKSIIGGDLSGRFPANFIHDGSQEVLELFPNTKSSPRTICNRRTNSNHEYGFKSDAYSPHNDSGSAARFFYCAKASRAERDMGCENRTPQSKCEIDKMGGSKCTMKTGSGNDRNVSYKNNHPTVKPIKLMEYLVKLVTPHSGVCLDPFMGSGSTGIACATNGFKFIGIEKDKGYFGIAQTRIERSSDGT